MPLKDELGFRKPLASRQHEAVLGVYYTANRLRKRADDFFRAHGLTDVQFNVMILLKHQGAGQGGLTQVELSRMLLVNRGNITTLIDRMERAGLVARTPVAQDRRYNLVVLTPKGREALDAAEPAYAAAVEDVMRPFSPQEVAQLSLLLERMRERLR